MALGCGSPHPGTQTDLHDPHMNLILIVLGTTGTTLAELMSASGYHTEATRVARQCFKPRPLR